jgi:DNA-binding MarR family transcriptional regulator
MTMKDDAAALELGLDKLISQLGGTLNQARTFVHIAAHPEVNPALLGTQLDIPASSISRYLRQFTQAGFVREGRSDDGRYKRLYLTQSGEALLTEALKLIKRGG